jgi:hypothetical protein
VEAPAEAAVDAAVEAPAEAAVDATPVVIPPKFAGCAAPEFAMKEECDDELMTEPPSDDEGIVFSHNEKSYIKRKYEGRPAVWDQSTGEHVGDWEGDWESDTGTINMVDSDSEDDE